MRKIASLLSVLVIMAVFAGCGAKPVETSKEKVATEDKGVLRVGMECGYAPFNWTQSSQELSNGEKAIPIQKTKDYAYGYDVMLAKMLADNLGMKLEIYKVEWSSIVLGMNAGDYDAIIAGMGYTEERSKSVDFTKPYYLRDNVIILKKDSPYAKATGLSGFTGASATTQLGTIWEQYVPQIPNVRKLTNYETTSEVVMTVATGTADCAVLDEPTAMSATLSNPELKYVKFNSSDGFKVPEGQSLNVCIAVKKGNTELREKLDSALQAVEWNEEKMVKLMDQAVKLQPLSK